MSVHFGPGYANGVEILEGLNKLTQSFLTSRTEDIFPVLYRKIYLLMDISANKEDREGTLENLRSLSEKIQKYLNGKIKIYNPVSEIAIKRENIIEAEETLNIVSEQIRSLEKDMDKTNLKMSLLNELNNYKITRGGENEYHYSGLFASKDMNMSTKIKAVEKIIDAINGNNGIEFEDKHIAALNESRLGKIINKYRDKDVLPNEFIEAEVQFNLEKAMSSNDPPVVF